MEVHLPNELDPHQRAELVAREKAYSQDLQRSGEWPDVTPLATRPSDIHLA